MQVAVGIGDPLVDGQGQGRVLPATDDGGARAQQHGLDGFRVSLIPAEPLLEVGIVNFEAGECQRVAVTNQDGLRAREAIDAQQHAAEAFR